MVKLANTGAIKKYDGLKHSGDEADARQLAHLLRLGILPTGTILPPEHRVVRDLARKRMRLVHSRTSHIIAIENIVARQRGMKINSNQIKKLTAMNLCKVYWTRSSTNVLLGRQSRQGESKTPLIA